MKTVAMRKAAKAKANGDGKKKKRVTRTKKVVTQRMNVLDAKSAEDYDKKAFGARFNPKDPGDVKRRTTKTKTTPRKKVVKKNTITDNVNLLCMVAI